MEPYKFDLTVARENIRHIMQALEDGWAYALEIYPNFKEFFEYCENVKQELHEKAVKEAEAYPENSFEAYGFKFEKAANLGARWDFKGIPEWEQKKAELKAIEDKYKAYFNARQKGLQAASDEGEELVMPKYKPGKEVVKVKG